MGRDRETNGQSSKLQRGHRQQTIANRSEDNVSVEGSIPEATVPEIDTSKPHPARMYDYYLGGKNHFAADRESGDMIERALPTIRVSTRANRARLVGQKDSQKGAIHFKVPVVIDEAKFPEFIHEMADA